MEKWDKKFVLKFHECYDGKYAGDINSPIIYSLSRKYVKGKVLDVGAGSGALIKLIPNAIGLDLAPKYKRIIKGDASCMPFTDETFDTIFATEILEHLDDETFYETINEIKRVLRVGGHLIITVPYKEDLEKDFVICPRCGAKFHRVGHMQTFDGKKIYLLLKTLGFKIIKVNVFPLSFMSTHKILRLFAFFLVKFGLVKAENLLVIALKQSFKS